MSTDALALLRCWGVEVAIAGAVYRIAAVPAADWIEAILTGGVVPGMFSEDAAMRLSQDVVDGVLTGDEFEVARRTVLTAAAGRPWWEAERLVLLLRDRADMIGGELIRTGFDFQTRSIGAFCAHVVATATRNLDKAERIKFESALSTPPDDVFANDEDAQAAAFLAAMSSTLS